MNRRTKTNPNLSTYAAAEALGITVSQFTRLMGKLGIAHDDEYENPHYRSAAPAKLWRKTKVNGLKRRKAVKELVATCQSRTAKRAIKIDAERRTALARLEERQRESAIVVSELTMLSTDALVAKALESMHALNRRAKHLRSRDRSATESIYATNDAFLHALVRTGRAKVYAFETERESRHMVCDGCGRDEQRRGGADVGYGFDWETAEGLLAFVREHSAAPDGAGEWLPFALIDYERMVRHEERARSRAGRQVLPAHDAVLTPEQTAEILSLPKKTVVALCAAGRLDGAFKAGRRWRIPGRAVRKMAGEGSTSCR